MAWLRGIDGLMDDRPGDAAFQCGCDWVAGVEGAAAGRN